MCGLITATIYEDVLYVLYTSYLLPSRSNIQINLCYARFTKSDNMVISLKFWLWTVHILRSIGGGLNFRTMHIFLIHEIRKYFKLCSKTKTPHCWNVLFVYYINIHKRVVILYAYFLRSPEKIRKSDQNL